MIQRAFQSFWSGLLVRLVRPSELSVVMVLNTFAFILAFVSKWALVWLALVVFAPSWLLPGPTAVSIAAQVLPALMVSVFVFVLGSFFVVTQQATMIHSNRASLLMLYDPRVHHAVARPLVISVATLLLALAAPSGSVSTGVAAFTLVLMLATAFTLANAATLLPYLLTRVTAPTNFALYALEDVEDLLAIGATGMVVYRVGLLGEMLKRGVRSGDSVQIGQALNGLTRFNEAYVRAAQVNPDARVHRYEDGTTTTGWLGEELVGMVVSAGQEAIGGDIANQDANRIAQTLATFGSSSAGAGHREEFIRATDGLCELATCTQQMKVPGLANVFSEPVWGLATMVDAARRHLESDSVCLALATWALAIGYGARHFTPLAWSDHVFWKRSLRLLGEDAPFTDAHAVLDSESFQRHWANKLASVWPQYDPSTMPPTEIAPGGTEAIHSVLDQARANA